MIKLNLLDEKDIPKNPTSSIKAEKIKTSSSGQLQKKITIGIIVVAAVYVLLLLYYFLMIKGPVKRIKSDLNSSRSVLNELKPKAEKVQQKEAELKKLEEFLVEIDKYVLTKKRWAQVLNILSNELPEEIIFSQVSIDKGVVKIKEKSPKGVIVTQKPSIIMKINLSTPSEFSNKIIQYKRKLEQHKVLDKLIYKIKDTGLSARRNEYSTSFSLYFIDSLKDDKE